MSFSFAAWQTQHPFLSRWLKLLPLFVIGALGLVYLEYHQVDFWSDLESPRRVYSANWPFPLQLFLLTGLVLAQATPMLWGVLTMLWWDGSPIALTGTAEFKLTKPTVRMLFWSVVIGSLGAAFVYWAVRWLVLVVFVIGLPDYHSRPIIFDIMLLPTGLMGWAMSPFFVYGARVLGNALRNPHGVLSEQEKV